MKRYITAILVVVVTACGAYGQSRAERTMYSTTRTAILKAERAVMNAIRSKDAAALKRRLSRNFILRSPGQPDVDREEFIKNVTSIPLTIADIHGEEMKVRVYRNVAVLTGIQRARTVDAAGQVETSSSAFTDIFVRRKGRWWLTSAYSVELPNRAP